MDGYSIISDLTDTDFNENINDKLQTCFSKLDTKLNDMNKDEVKDLCVGKNLSPKAKHNKQELKELVVNEFSSWVQQIKGLVGPKLKDMCREKKLSGFSTLKKDELILLLANNYISELDKPSLDSTSSSESAVTQEQTTITTSTKKPTKKTTKKTSDLVEDETVNSNLDDQIAKLLELKAKQDAEKAKEQARLEAEEQARKEAEEKLRLEAEAKEQAKQESEKKKKAAIPKAVKTAVWDLYIGPDIVKHRCLCCKKSHIKNTEFQVGHVISEKDGGTLEISNLRPICAPCNFSMGTENMVEYIKKYGYYL